MTKLKITEDPLKKFKVGQKVRVAKFTKEMGLISVPSHLVGKVYTIDSIDAYDGIPAARGMFGASRWWIPISALANLRRGEITYRDLVSPDLIKVIESNPTADITRGMIRSQLLIAIPKDLTTAEAIFQYIEDQYPYDTSEPPVPASPPPGPINQDLEVDVTLTAKRKTVEVETEFWRWSGSIEVPASVVVNGKEAIETWIKANAMSQLDADKDTDNDIHPIYDGECYDSVTEDAETKRGDFELIEIEDHSVEAALEDAAIELGVANE